MLCLRWEQAVCKRLAMRVQSVDSHLHKGIPTSESDNSCRNIGCGGARSSGRSAINRKRATELCEWQRSSFGATTQQAKAESAEPACRKIVPSTAFPTTTTTTTTTTTATTTRTPTPPPPPPLTRRWHSCTKGQFHPQASTNLQEAQSQHVIYKTSV